MALIEGTVIQFTDGTTGKVRTMIGRGGQGEVYKIDYNGETKALKWFKNHPGPEVSRSIHANILRKSTLPDYFYWPIAVCDNQLGFGYVMDLVDTDTYKELKKFIYKAETCNFKNYRVTINACLNLCVAFKKLHAYGLAYFDMNEGNFFFNPENGNLIIIDTDNIAPAGEIVTNVQGTIKYMAPELLSFVKPKGMSSTEVKRIAPRPNRYTDYCSLAFVLFRLIFIDHPLEGAYLDKYPCLTLKVQRYIYGKKPIFIYDPKNNDNRPNEESSPTVVRRWNNVPSFVREIFVKAFSQENLHNSTQRLMESEWIKIFIKWRSHLCRCPHCNKETYLSYKEKGLCTKCNKNATIYWMAVTEQKLVLPLVNGFKIYGDQVGLNNSFFYVVAQIAIHKNKTMIRNSSNFEWVVCSPNSSARVVKPKEVIDICDEMKIRFNDKYVSIKLR